MLKNFNANPFVGQGMYSGKCLKSLKSAEGEVWDAEFVWISHHSIEEGKNHELSQ
jgi:hypothetical protein